jgi:PAS domain S-box-containing protein
MDSLLDTAPCGFVSTADDGTMVEVNTTLAELLGYTRVELQGWHIEKILFPGARIFYQTHVFPMLRMHNAIEEIYIVLRTRGGEGVPTLMNGIRRERNGRMVSDNVFMRMIQRHQYEDQLLHARRLAEEANAAKASFLSMMSHDLRTPLTTILGHADLLAAGVLGAQSTVQGESEQRYSIDRVRDASRELLRMINDILSFAQVEAGRLDVRLEPVPVSKAVARAESLLRLRMQDFQLEFIAEPCDADMVVRADPDRLQQILLNILTNAIKYTYAGGRITVACQADGNRVRIRVHDTGVGIPSDRLESVFEPFVQLDTPTVTEAPRGVGLGLAISRDLARAMGGDVMAESTHGAGSIFTIELPRA